VAAHTSKPRWHGVLRLVSLHWDNSAHPVTPEASPLRERVMQCKCGGETNDHEVVRDGETVARYKRCRVCGFIAWIWNMPEWPRERFWAEGAVNERQGTMGF